MFLSLKSLYALRAVFELCLWETREPVKIGRIALAQDIPSRFLEVILNRLKHAGYVESRRGKDGGYILSISPRELTAGQVVEAVQGAILEPEKDGKDGKKRALRGDYAFGRLRERVNGCISSVYARTSFADLVELEKEGSGPPAVNYMI